MTLSYLKVWNKFKIKKEMNGEAVTHLKKNKERDFLVSYEVS